VALATRPNVEDEDEPDLQRVSPSPTLLFTLLDFRTWFRILNTRIFSHLTPLKLVDMYQRFVGTRCVHLFSSDMYGVRTQKPTFSIYCMESHKSKTQRSGQKIQNRQQACTCGNHSPKNDVYEYSFRSLIGAGFLDYTRKREAHTGWFSR